KPPLPLRIVRRDPVPPKLLASARVFVERTFRGFVPSARSVWNPAAVSWFARCAAITCRARIITNSGFASTCPACSRQAAAGKILKPVARFLETPARVAAGSLSDEEENKVALKMTTREVDGVSVVALDGRIVLGEESNALREKIKSLIAENKKKIVLNMDNVTFID